MKFTNDFSADMSKVYSLVDDLCGGYNIQEALFSWFNGDIDISADNEADWVESYEYSKNGMLNVLYEVVNYDLISISKRKIDIDNSNHPEIAAIFKKWAKPGMVQQVYNAIHG